MKSATFSNVSFTHGLAQAVATTGRAPEGDLKLPVKWVLSRTRKEVDTRFR